MLQIANAPDTVGGTLRKVQKALSVLIFPACGPLPPDHGFPDGRTVIGNALKSIVKQSIISISVGAHGYGSLAARWGRTQERCGSQCATLGNLGKNQGSCHGTKNRLHGYRKTMATVCKPSRSSTSSKAQLSWPGGRRETQPCRGGCSDITVVLIQAR